MSGNYDNLGLTTTGAPGVDRNDVQDHLYVQTTFRSNNGVNMFEATANPQTTSAGNGSVWVRNDVPNNLIFTNDAGTDIDLTGAGAVEDLATTLVAGNITGGTNVVVTIGDSITAPGALPLTAVTNISATAPDVFLVGDATVSNPGNQVNLILEGDDNLQARMLQFRSGAANGWDLYAPSAGESLILAQNGTAVGTNFTIDTTGNLEFANVNTGLQVPALTPTQLTSIATPVACDSHRGVITMQGVITTAGSPGAFTVTTSYVTAASSVFLTVDEGLNPVTKWGIDNIVNGVSFDVVYNNDTIADGTVVPVVHFFIVN